MSDRNEGAANVRFQLKEWMSDYGMIGRENGTMRQPE